MGLDTRGRVSSPVWSPRARPTCLCNHPACLLAAPTYRRPPTMVVLAWTGSSPHAHRGQLFLTFALRPPIITLAPLSPPLLPRPQPRVTFDPVSAAIQELRLVPHALPSSSPFPSGRFTDPPIPPPPAPSTSSWNFIYLKNVFI